jgi:hypothetical protein
VCQIVNFLFYLPGVSLSNDDEFLCRNLHINIYKSSKCMLMLDHCYRSASIWVKFIVPCLASLLLNF